MSRFVLILAFAFAFLFVGVFIFHPVYVSVCATTEHGQPQNCEQYHVLLAMLLKIGQVLSHAETWTALATIAIAFFTAFLKRSTDNLWETNKQQIKLAREEFIASHRPQIRIKHLKLENEIWQGEPIIVSLTCLNNGEVDALLQELGLKYLIVRSDRDLPLEPDIPAIVNFSNARLSVGRNLTIPTINAGKVLSDAENSAIQQGRAKLYCVGWVSCLDEANRMRITGFCRVLTFPEDALADVHHARFRTHPDPDYEYQD